MSGGKILVIRGGAMRFRTDAAVLSALPNRFPQARLGVLGIRTFAQLALAGGLADEVRSHRSAPAGGLFCQHGTLAGTAGLLRRFRGDSSPISTTRIRFFQSNVARCSPAQFIACPHRPGRENALHATEVFLKPLERLAIF